mgnify:CR=1 FL=1
MSASRSDIESWELFRPDIAEYVRGDDIWFDPKSGEQLKHCPWLQQDSATLKYSCDIYEDRPEDCRHYPVSIDDMIKDNCEMIELKDLTAPKQAQQQLDRLMADSRPPLADS